MAEKPLSCVLLADRHHGLTESVRGLLETMFASVVMVADEASLLDSAVRLRPDVVVVDLSLAQDRGLSWLRAVRQRCPDLKIIVVSVHDEESVRRAVMDAGADALVLKRTMATDLLAAIALVRGGGGARAVTTSGINRVRRNGDESQARNDGAREARTCVLALAAAMVAGSWTPAAAQTASDEWHVTVEPYFMGAAMSGPTTVRGQEMSVDLSASDILDNLQFGVMGMVMARKGNWGFGGDAIWMSLGTTVQNTNVDFSEGAFAFYGLRRLGAAADRHLRSAREHPAGRADLQGVGASSVRPRPGSIPSSVLCCARRRITVCY